jgi:16S rRNA (guanine966-N2)-methyltransferase
MSILGPRIPGARVLDLFAGTGALGLECLSRGAAHVDFVETGPRALEALRKNVADLGVDSMVTIRRRDAISVVTSLHAGEYDIVVADPPYDTEFAARIVNRFREVPFAAVLAVEHEPGAAVEGDDTRVYGDTAITFCYRP